MSHSPLFKKAVKAINEEGALLVFPINNKKEPSSVWSALWPKSKMRWEWDESADNRVVQLWYLKEELSRSGDIIYSKWYQGRATCFSKEVFKHMMAAFRAHEVKNKLKIPESRNILEALEMDSPLSTKQIKEAASLQGKSFEGHYNKAMRALWIPGLITGFGEVQDSSFPSLAVGATSVLFEELWLEAADLDPSESLKWLEKKLGAENLFFKFMVKQLKMNTVIEKHLEL
jgi:hypothetical protein